ncbi:GPI biosynthesis protein family Pig-F-domain-containing protein [Phlebopus sp. FC_14]|nr:GPI biosynthesis protein family Pig-F-domain-containing protein [Phlebopus sp. FC_14]
MPSKPKPKPSNKGTASRVDTITYPPERFPFAQYASVVGVHLMLMVFTALYLPQTTRLFRPAAAPDRAQSDFMEALTANPVSTLGWTCAGLVILEVWWASWVRKWYFEQTERGTEDEIKLDRMQFRNLRLTRFREAFAFTLYATLGAYVITILFGAPLSSHVLRTILLAFAVATTAAFPPAFALGCPSLASGTAAMVTRLIWTRLFAELSPRNAIERAIVYPAVGAVAGAWTGTIPIALDWDRPWQAWPLALLFGSLAGYIVGSLLALQVTTAKWLAYAHVRSPYSKCKTT